MAAENITKQSKNDLRVVFGITNSGKNTNIPPGSFLMDDNSSPSQYQFKPSREFKTDVCQMYTTSNKESSYVKDTSVSLISKNSERGFSSKLFTELPNTQTKSSRDPKLPNELSLDQQLVISKLLAKSETTTPEFDAQRNLCNDDSKKEYVVISDTVLDKYKRNKLVCCIPNGLSSNFGLSNQFKSHEQYNTHNAEYANCVHNLININEWTELKIIINENPEEINGKVTCRYCRQQVGCTHVKYELNDDLKFWTIKNGKSFYCKWCNKYVMAEQQYLLEMSLIDQFSKESMRYYKIGLQYTCQIMQQGEDLRNWMTNNQTSLVIKSIYNMQNKLSKGTSLNFELLSSIFCLYYIVILIAKRVSTSEIESMIIKDGSKDIREINNKTLKYMVDSALLLYTNANRNEKYDKHHSILEEFWEDCLQKLETQGNDESGDIYINKSTETANAAKISYTNMLRANFDEKSVLKQMTGLSELGYNKTFGNVGKYDGTILEDVESDIVNTGKTSEVFTWNHNEIEDYQQNGSFRTLSDGVDSGTTYDNRSTSMYLIGNDTCKQHDWNWELNKCTLCDMKFVDAYKKQDYDVQYSIWNSHIVNMLKLGPCPVTKKQHTTNKQCNACSYPNVDKQYVSKYGYTLYNTYEGEQSDVVFRYGYNHKVQLDKNLHTDSTTNSIISRLPPYPQEFLVILIKMCIRTINGKWSDYDVDWILNLSDVGRFVVKNDVSMQELVYTCNNLGSKDTEVLDVEEIKYDNLIIPEEKIDPSLLNSTDNDYSDDETTNKR